MNNAAECREDLDMRQRRRDQTRQLKRDRQIERCGRFENSDRCRDSLDNYYMERDQEILRDQGLIEEMKQACEEGSEEECMEQAEAVQEETADVDSVQDVFIRRRGRR